MLAILPGHLHSESIFARATSLEERGMVYDWDQVSIPSI